MRDSFELRHTNQQLATFKLDKNVHIEIHT